MGIHSMDRLMKDTYTHTRVGSHVRLHVRTSPYKSTITNEHSVVPLHSHYTHSVYATFVVDPYVLMSLPPQKSYYV